MAAPVKINRWQHAHLKERVRSHELQLYRDLRKDYPLIRDPERVAQARKIVEEWDAHMELIEKAVETEIKAAAKFTEQQFLFQTPEAGLAALTLFESASVESYREQVTTPKI